MEDSAKLPLSFRNRRGAHCPPCFVRELDHVELEHFTDEPLEVAGGYALSRPFGMVVGGFECFPRLRGRGISLLVREDATEIIIN